MTHVMQRTKALRSIKRSRYVFLLPGLIMFCFAIFIPFCMGLNIAFTDWNGIDKTYNYIGLDNFIKAFSDTRIVKPIRNSLLYMVLGTGFGTIVSLGLALMVHNRLLEGNRHLNWLSRFARTAFFTPVCISAVLTAFIGKFIFGEVITELIGGKSFLGQKSTVIPAIVSMGIWNGCGINMLIYYSGLKGIPTDLYDAAAVDGAGAIRTFFKVTLPLLMPSFSVCVTLSLTSWLREFGMTLAATNGGPAGASKTITIYIYENLYSYSKAGYGQALSLLFALFLIILGRTVSGFFRKREVEY